MKARVLIGGLFLLAATAKGQYCVPDYITGCLDGDNINSFVMMGENGTAINDTNTHCSPAAYNSQPNVSITLAQGATYQSFINSDYSDEAAQVFIDFNDDFVFSGGETVGGANYIDDIGTTFNLIIPAAANTGTHRMRIVLTYDFGYPFVNGCPTQAAGYDYGEVHDYSVNIITGTGGPACLPPASIAASGATGTSVDIIWSTVSGALGYEYVLDQNSGSPSGSGTFTTASSLNPANLTPNVQYFLHVRTKCGASSFSPWFDHAFVTYGSGSSCIAPDGFTASGITGTSATLSWNPAPGTMGYEIFLTEVPSLIPLNGTPVSTSGAFYNTLMPYTTYYGYLRQECAGSTVSDWAMITLNTGGTIMPSPGTIQGNIYESDTALFPSSDTYKVWLIRFDSASNSLLAVDSTIDVGGYYFSNVTSGSYLVKAALLSVPATGFGQVPTYHDSSLYWNTAGNIIMTNGAQLYRDVWMRNGVVTTGPGFISGNVGLGANKGTGTGVPGLMIYLRNGSGKLVKAMYTDANGSFTFNNLPTGIYDVYPEHLNYATTSYANISVSSAQTSQVNVDFNQDDEKMNIKPKSITGLHTINQLSFGMSPNPARETLHISVDASDVRLEVSDMTGRILISQVLSSGSTGIDIAALVPGTYLVRVKGAQGSAIQKLIVGH